MEELEPWNMFTNDFVTDETDPEQMLADANAIIGEYAKNETEKNGNGNEDEESEDDSNLLIPEVEMGGGDGELPNNNGKDDSNDDNAIFNFDLEIPKAPEKLKGSHYVAKENTSSNKKEIETLINYDCAIVYMCPACGTEFSTQEQWKRHLNGVHSFNTRRGLNFVQIDKLYHECLECQKRIAMHSMENLLKHKYTHLPYRCAKCKFCQRQYKYRQDLTVHLRAQHHDELMRAAKAAQANIERQQDFHQNGRGLAIRDIRENAVDAFDNSFVNNVAVHVKNELMDPPEENDLDANAEHSSNSFMLPSFLEDALSHSSSKNSEQQSNDSVGGANEEQVAYEKQIQYICPDCGQEYGTQNQWQSHIVSTHNFGTRQGLNFEEINYNRQARCLECNEIIPVNVIHHLQQHKFTHLPHKSWLRCKICFKTFIGRQEIVKHLMTQHSLDAEKRNSSSANRAAGGGGGENDYDDSQDIWDGDDSLLVEEQRAPTKEERNEERDKFDKHIDYLCPMCGKEFRVKKLWRKHIVQVHKLTNLEILKFKNINEREVMCLDCGKVITNAYGIQNAQQHYFTHMPFKSFIRCRLCGKSYTDRKGLVKHLRGKHLGRIKMLKSSGSSKPYILPQHTQPTGTPQRTQFSLKPQQQSSVQQKTSQLLSQALQRPLRATDESPNKTCQPAAKRLRESRPKEFVTHKNYIFEIAFLDEDDDGECDDEVGLVNAAAIANDGDDDNDDDVLLVPEISTTNSSSRQSTSFNGRERCADCGSIFSTTEALRSHIRKEHDFNERSDGQYGDQSTPKDNFMNENDDDDDGDGDGLLVPSGVAAVEYSNSSTPWMKSTSEAERHFTYLCPACGVEHYTQMDWRRHINGVHNFDKRHYLNFRQLDQYRYQCTICQDVVTKSKLKSLQDHKFRHLPYKSYLKCKLCGTLYNHKPNMYGHLQVRHNINMNKPLGGNDDDFVASRMSQNVKQQPNINSRPNNNRSFGYQPASSSTPTSSSISSAAKSSHSSNSTFAKPPGLKTVEDVITFHNAVDHATITYFCPSCNENFDSHVFWRKHIVEEHNLNSKEGLNFRQIDEHHYLCLQCYKRVTVTHTKGAIGQLQSHKFRHLPYRSFKCLNCNGEFVRKQMFFKHLNRATNRCENATQANAQTDDQQAASVHDQNNRNLHNNEGNANFGEDNADGDQQESGINTGLIINQDAFVLVCPQCGEEFESQRFWREHINIEHELGKRERLRFKKINPSLHTCLECGERVNGRKLRDLQIHRFKHLPYGPYIQCKFCKTGYNHIRNMQDHLRQKHPNVVQKHDEYAKMEEMRMYEENSLTDADSIGGSSVLNEAELDEAVDEVEVIPDIGEGEDDEQYLLG